MDPALEAYLQASFPAAFLLRPIYMRICEPVAMKQLTFLDVYEQLGDGDQCRWVAELTTYLLNSIAVRSNGCVETN